MGVAFPSSINNKMQMGSFSEQPISDIIKSQMEVGNVKTRLRTTRVRYRLTGSIELDDTEYAAFKTFYTSSLAQGSLPVSFLHPFEGVEKDFIMMYTANDIGAFNVMVNVTLEEV